jgi:hypothetical protein
VNPPCSIPHWSAFVNSPAPIQSSGRVLVSISPLKAGPASVRSMSPQSEGNTKSIGVTEVASAVTASNLLISNDVRHSDQRDTTSVTTDSAGSQARSLVLNTRRSPGEKRIAQVIHSRGPVPRDSLAHIYIYIPPNYFEQKSVLP